MLRKEGSRLVLTPVQPISLLGVLARLKPLKEDFPPIKDKPPRPVRI